MAGGKVSPRQKMINMMYLVLTALLALNVSKEILKSFHLFEKSFDNAAKNIDAKNEATMGALLKSADEKPLKTKPYLERAKKAEGIATDFMKYVDGLISKTEEMYGGAEARNQEGELLAADQMEQHANYFGEENENHGVELQAKINETRTALLNILKPDANDSLYNIKDNKVYDNALASCQLWAKDPEGGVGQSSWVSENLVHVPAAGLMAIFSRLKNDAKTLEAEVLEQLASRIDATDYKFDKLEAKVLAKATSVMKGEPYEADILLVASNSKANPTITIGGSPINIEGGVGKFSAGTAGATGSKSYSGEIVVQGPEGIKSFPFTGEYQVFAPSASIAADQMNLLYIGINNPLTISASGFSDAQVNVRASGATLKKTGNGKYNAKVTRGPKEAIISVTTKDGKNLGKQKFRIRSLPQPTAQLGGIPNDGLPKGRASVGAQNRIIATMGAGFAYDLKYRVTRFTMIMAYKRKPPKMAQSSSGMLTGQMVSLLRSAQSGDRIVFEQIRASEAKYGFKANLSPIVISIK